MNFDLITTVLLSLVTVWLLFTNIMKVNGFKTSEVFSFLFFGTILFVISIEFIFFSQSLSFYKFLEYRSMAVILMHATVLGTIGLLSIQELNSKKIKTIWRLPILGLLLGFFAINFHLYIQLGIGLITLLVYFKSRSSLRLIQRMILIHLVCVIAVISIKDYQFWLFNLVLIIYIINLKSIWDMLRLKQACSEGNE